ncbi:tRNA (guanosine(37)-N1)-methyltransferase TrmD [Chenggangzhangella methanolivorans]|uniref:tRNA (guanine-N(1)-)-methyltransferase n=1 Tax=Chenggangzhangella methanolivorans TaxID=1437009 RepID=A0A9E6R6Z5_9HYPH|nr:tRNA (guanosine(37)-N1)-methyltransferase TrmD [Chenggangzhangella methanolivorans]QZN98439.1 tRNA (guanosine(37)-N1)-methyltransferase TrmD [Chenggangzhangella methanolivorans]
MWRAAVLTLYPAMFPGVLGHALAGRALGRAWSLDARDIRAHAIDRHATVDDAPAGGGPGMVLRADVLAAALDAGGDDGRPRLLMTPRGTPLAQARIRELASGPGVVIVCGRFEGVDERVIEARGLEEVSVGDVVLSGGEAAAQLLLDACVRLLPGVMGHEASGDSESFEAPLIEHPHYTKPREFEGRSVPPELVSGDHKATARWRRLASLQATRARRPDLWAKYVASITGGVDKRRETE